MDDEEHFRKLERLFASAPINRFYTSALRVSKGAAEITFPVERKYHHAAEALHGSVSFKLLDDAAWFAVASTVEDHCVLTVSFTIHLLRPVSEGTLVARGRLVHASRQLFVAESELHCAGGRQVARGSGTFMRTRIPLTPEIGYR